MDYPKYSAFLRDNEGKAENTIQAYTKDLKIFENFLAEKGIDSLQKATNTEIVAYLIRMKTLGKTESTANRRLVALRAYYDYAKAEGLVENNPTDGIKTPKIDRKEIKYISEEEVVKFIETPDDTPKGKRDRAIFELMYATGMRASEIVTAKMSELNLRMSFIMCDGEHGKARVIPIGGKARQALEEYIENVRPRLLRQREKDEDSLFVNYNGMPLSRQGLWKIFGEYGKKSGLSVRMTPKILRNSFAVHMLQNGADLKSLQDMLGHEDISATEVYLSATKNRIKDVYDRAHPRA